MALQQLWRTDLEQASGTRTLPDKTMRAHGLVHYAVLFCIRQITPGRFFQYGQKPELVKSVDERPYSGFYGAIQAQCHCVAVRCVVRPGYVRAGPVVKELDRAAAF